MVTLRDDRTHPLLAQVALTVSPFISLPTAATLPYTYKTMPSTLPPPASGVTGASDAKVKYVVAAQSGHAAHPDDIIASCRALQAHIDHVVRDSERLLRELQDDLRARELAEKRRVAPGWLDSDARLLQPERRPGSGGASANTLGEGEGEGERRGGGEDSASAARNTPGTLGMEQQFFGLNIAEGGAGPFGHHAGGISEMGVDHDQGVELDRAFARTQ